MPLLKRCSSLALVASILSPAITRAQNPWTVTVVPPARGMPIGTCGAVRLQMLNRATNDVPRRPTGAYVTIADFDMKVTTPDGKSVAGFWRDAYNWEACACKAATAGTKATVTATYPASSLTTGASVPGVAFSVTGAFALSESQSTTDPRACYDLAFGAKPLSSPTSTSSAATLSGSSATAITGISSPTSGTIARSPATAPASAPTAVTTSAPLASTPVAPIAQQPVGAKTPVTSGVVSIPIPAIPTGGKVAIAAPPASAPIVPINPSGFTATETSQGVVRFSWRSVGGASYYVLLGPGLPLGGVKVAQSGLAQSGDLPTSVEITYTASAVPPGDREWLVASYYEPGPVSTPAASFPRVSLSVSYPVPVNPSAFQAVQTAVGRVRLSWQPVNGASYYTLSGPGSTAAGVRVDTAASGFAASNGTVVVLPDVVFVATQVPGGTHQWSVGSYYDPAGMSSPIAAFSKVTLDVTPPINPSGFVGVQIAPGQVRLSWKPVDGVSYYRLTGSGLPLNGVRVNPGSSGASGADGTIIITDMEYIVNAVGLSTWQVGSFYNPGPISTPFLEFPRITLDVSGPGK